MTGPSGTELPGTKVMLIDGNSLAYRAFYALPPLVTTDGTPTNAVYGFITMLLRLLEEERPTHIAVALDKGRTTFRTARFSEYKANRASAPDAFRCQIPLLREILDAFQIPVFEVEGYEADDIIGTLSRQARELGFNVLIVSGDKDILQLISDGVEALVTRRGISETERFDLEKVRAAYEFEPRFIADLKGLMGDASDNIPGVPGIGEKTALSLLGEYGSLENLIEHLDEVTKPAIADKLRQHTDRAILSKWLATIDTSAPVELDLERCSRKEPDAARLVRDFERLEFHSLIKRITKGETPNLRETSRMVSGHAAGLNRLATAEEIRSFLREVKAAGRCCVWYEMGRTNGPPSPARPSTRSTPSLSALYFCLPSGEGFELVQPGESEVNELGRLFADPKVEKVGFDLKPLIGTLLDSGISIEGPIFDLMIAAYLLDPARSSYRLEDLIRAHLPLDEEVSNPLEAISVLMEPLLLELERANLVELYREVEAPLIQVLADMERTGVAVDEKMLHEMSRELGIRIDELVSEIYSLAGTRFNINSPRQLGEVLFDKLGLPRAKKTKTGYSTDAEVLESLAGQHEIVARLLEYRQLVKLRSTYVDGLKSQIDPSSGRIHSTFHQTVTATGRISSSEPNLQNIPVRMEIGRKIRKVFVPRPGWKLLAADYSQIELRVLAHISQDPNLIQAFRNDEDIHAHTASEVFGVPDEMVTPEMRMRAKAVNFGIVYGISDYGLARDIGIDRKKAAEYIQSYFVKYPKVKEYLDSIVERARECGYVTTILNRRRFLPDINSRNRSRRQFAERTAMNTPIQGSAADIIKLAMVRCYERIKNGRLRSKMILQVHDELVFEVPVNEMDEVRRIVKEEMETAIPLSVPLKVEVKAGDNWLDMARVQ